MTRRNTRLSIAILADESHFSNLGWIQSFINRDDIIEERPEIIVITAEENIILHNDKSILKIGYCFGENRKERFMKLQQMCAGDYITFIRPGDDIPDHFMQLACDVMNLRQEEVAFTQRSFRGKVIDPFTNPEVQDCHVVDIMQDASLMPIGLGGVFVSSSLFCDIDILSLLEYDLYRSMLIALMIKQPKMLYMGNLIYSYEKPMEYHVKKYHPNKKYSWYYDYKTEFLFPLFQKIQQEQGYLPEFVQSLAMYMLDSRVQAILAKRNRKVGDATDYILESEDILCHINQSIYYNKYGLMAYMSDVQTRKLYYQKDYPYYISVVYVASGDEENNRETLSMLRKQDIDMDRIQIIICDKTGEQDIAYFNELYQGSFQYVNCRKQTKAQIINGVKKYIQGEYVVFLRGGDEFGPDYLEKLYAFMVSAYRKEDVTLGMSRKYYILNERRKLDYICSPDGIGVRGNAIIDLCNEYSCFPHFFYGTIIRKETFLENSMPECEEGEKVFFLDLLMKNPKIGYVGEVIYDYKQPVDWMFDFYPGIYEQDWYYKYVFEFWPEYLSKVKESNGEVPLFMQYYMMYLIKARFDASYNNRNKHVVPVEECYDYIWRYHDLLQYVDDKVITNTYYAKLFRPGANLITIFLKIKYNNQNLPFHYYETESNIYLCYDYCTITSINDQKVNILFINYEHGRLEIDGTLSTLFPSSQFTYGVFFEDQFYALEYNDMYSHTKFFGKPVYKRQSFHVSLPLEGSYYESPLDFIVKNNDTGNIVRLELSFKSHFSRLTDSFENSYWVCQGYVLYMYEGFINISDANKKWIRKRERHLIKEMAGSRLPSYKKHTLMRILYHIFSPFFKNKNIWLFYDKIYKGGDSSEYLYKYTLKQSNNIKAYYLLDRKSADYKRLKKEGYRPLRRASLRHRLVFLYAKMMVISNSTVFAFNNYYMKTSIFMKDLVDFHVVCVQHGLSVQKIAIAQNRLRDNIRLYYCASKYEIENLSRPVYGYVGHNALRLTGVPRYDGLVSNDKRQILLSPTWRMQSARPVTQNEGVERDYNEDFVNTPYYEVYNSLINNTRLLEAAKQYGYRILYVLHPIVSPQAEDFEKNDYVDIVPATGDMSYEKVFVESSLMVTDYSGVQFDFAYMNKPVVYLHHHKIPQHYEEGTYHYDTMAFGEITHDNEELVDVLVDYMKHDCKMKDEYSKRVDDFYAFHDQNNCKRIYEDMVQYQDGITYMR